MPGPRNQAPTQDRTGPSQRTKYTDKGEGAISGNITKEPELRFTGDGKPLVVLRVAESIRQRDDESGEWKDGPTAYYDVTAWGKQAENVAECLVKGDRVAVVGRWQQQDYSDAQGAPQTKMVLVARDIGPSLLFLEVTVSRKGRGE